MAANRVYGAPEALAIVRNAPAVANFCNDFVGDICGTVSGAVGATIAINAALAPGTFAAKFASTAVIALISAATVAGKAAGKGAVRSGTVPVVPGQRLNVPRPLPLRCSTNSVPARVSSSQKTTW